uniref:Uncharacterized protein n=1 Tax=Haptolina ericina TaxID=156174 RepID=A0A7S3B1C3_9EUKA|mmetsp:Transcript_46682/g.105266  ORF Transcript_46682/g.105266 Transcript_46682/m.105266 type:complete len:141 (+) Transcript_46682:2-424(+)
MEAEGTWSAGGTFAAVGGEAEEEMAPEASEVPKSRAASAIDARIAELLARRKQLESYIEEQEALQEEEELQEPQPATEVVAPLARFRLRMPADVKPGQKCAAMLPSGRRVEFVAPPDAVPGMGVVVVEDDGTGEVWFDDL